jgi:hypothetical protein
MDGHSDSVEVLTYKELTKASVLATMIIIAWSQVATLYA